MLPPVPSGFTLPTTIPTQNFFDDVGPAPPGLLKAVMSAVPQSVFPDLMQAGGRRSLASDFAAGHTPEWFQALPTDVKQYLTSIAAKMTSDEIAVPTYGPLVTSGGLTLPTDEAGDSGSGSGSASSSSSTDAAARPTGAVAGGLAIAVGILGAAIAL